MTFPVDPRLVVASLLVAAAIFAFDVLLGPHIAPEIAYVGLILLCLRSTWPPFGLWLATLATLLVVAAYLMGPQSLSMIEFLERGLALLVIWLTALLCSRQILTANQLAEAHAKLLQQKDKATTTAIRASTALRSERHDRVRIADALEEREHRYRAVFNQTFQLVAVLQPSGAVEEINETMRRAAALKAGEGDGKPVWDLPLWDADGRSRLRRATASAGAGDFFRDEFHIVRAGGSSMIVDLSLKPIRDPAGAVDLIILEARDITQQKSNQAQLVQAQKMEVLGQFASGIAHDFNNLLTVIAGNIELVQRRIKDNGTVSQRMTKAVDAVFQGRELTSRILAFARKQDLEPHSVDVHELVAGAIELSQSGLDENTSIRSEIEPDLWPCWADTVQLQTALFNLLINARDAMPNGGEILLRARNLTVRHRDREGQPNLHVGDYVVLSITDGGEGIPAELIKKVTDPFFTTKDAGSGSGLGLSMVDGFVEQSGGALEIESTEGKGTTISLYLPRSLLAASSQARQGKVDSIGVDAHVLVVEDDLDVRDAAVSMLSDLGYRVAEASDSEEALALLRRGHRFDLILTDIMMPGEKDGRELGRLARSILPDARILYSSAHPQKVAEFRSTKNAKEDFIPKPYHYGELAQKTKALLSHEAGEIKTPEN